MAKVLSKAVALVALPVLLGAAGCGAQRVVSSPVVEPRFQPTGPDHAAPGCAPGRELRVGNKRTAFAARALGTTPAFARPAGRPLRTFGRRNQNGVSTVFGVLAVVKDRSCAVAWYRVQLPLRPNGTTGYVRADDVHLFAVHTRIQVDLSERRVDFFRNGRRLLRATAGVGSPATPTPTGRFYVNQRLRAADPSGPFGPAAIGISAFSPVLTQWTQGGPIAVHGTNDPSSIGRAASHGCLRIANTHLARMYALMPEGTPVLVRP